VTCHRAATCAVDALEVVPDPGTATHELTGATIASDGSAPLWRASFAGFFGGDPVDLSRVLFVCDEDGPAPPGRDGVRANLSSPHSDVDEHQRRERR
jgi:hypothetical protein